MKKVLIFISLIVFAIGSCKKVDLDEMPSGTPVFIVDAELDGVALNLVAGDDDFYMFSEFSKDTLDVYTLTGRLAKDNNCQSDCEESLSFSIRSSFADSIPNQPFDIDQAIKTSFNFKYFTDNIVSVQNGFRYNFSAEFIDSFNVVADSFLWTINNDTFSGEFPIYEHFDNTDLDVRLEVLTSEGCVSYFEKIIPVGFQDDCGLSIEIIPDNSFSMFYLNPILSAPVGGNVSYVWNQDSLGNDSFLIDSNFQIPPNNIISLSASNNNCTVDLGVCVGDINPNTSLPSSIGYSKFNFMVDNITQVISIVEEQLSAVTIEYQDSTGVYSSYFADNSNNTFTITNIEDYEDNENGEKTKKLTISYDCILRKEGSGEEKNIIGTAEIAVAYPE